MKSKGNNKLLKFEATITLFMCLGGKLLSVVCHALIIIAELYICCYGYDGFCIFAAVLVVSLLDYFDHLLTSMFLRRNCYAKRFVIEM